MAAFCPSPQLRMSPAASHPRSTVPAAHRSGLGVLWQTRTALRKSNREFQNRATVGSGTAQSSFSLYHFCDFPLKSLCHLTEHRPVSFWVTVRLVGATNSAKWTAKQKQTEQCNEACYRKRVRRNMPTVFSKATCPNIHGVTHISSKVLQKPWTSYTILTRSLCEIKSSQIVIQTKSYWQGKSWNKMFLLL